MNRLKSSMLVVLALATLVNIALVHEPVEAQGSAALSIPPRKNYTIEPGQGVNDTVQIRNLDTERPLNLSMRAIDFTFTDDGGTPNLMLAEDAPQTAWSIKPFLTIPETVTIQPNSTASLDLDINIPENQGAGSYYSAIVYSSGASEGGNVGLSASGVSLIFVNVPGEVNEKLSIEKVGAYNVELSKYKLFNMNMPMNIGYTIKNEGTVAESPVGSVSLKNIILGKEIAINDVNPNKSLTLIGQTRTFTVCIKQTNQEVEFNGSREEATTCSDKTGIWPGIYRVSFNGYYGWNGNATQEIVGKAWMIYTPIWFIIALLLVLAFAGYHIWKLTRFIQAKRGGGPKPRRTTLRTRR